MNEYIKLYYLEQYLFGDVRHKFQDEGELSAFDFFCIIIWKANRSKSTIATRLLKIDSKRRNDLNAIVKDITSAVHNAKDVKDRMRVLIEDWSFRLPIASAILTILYPENFTVYDRRVCDTLEDCHKVQNKTRFDDLWNGYEDFVEKVNQKSPRELSLRDKDRYLWGRSFKNDLEGDINNLFQKR